jgi:hypothetical protein
MGQIILPLESHMMEDLNSDVDKQFGSLLDNTFSKHDEIEELLWVMKYAYRRDTRERANTRHHYYVNKGQYLSLIRQINTSLDDVIASIKEKMKWV